MQEGSTFPCPVGPRVLDDIVLFFSSDTVKEGDSTEENLPINEMFSQQ